MIAAPRTALADATRRITEEHTDWDSPHQFITLHWDGKQISHGTFAVITPDVHPTIYPSVMAKIAREELEGERRDSVYAYALQIEGWGVVEPKPDASLDERVQFEADRLGRKFATRPDAVEIATTWCADVHGRAWAATKRRTHPGLVEEEFWAPDTTPRPGGRMVTGLLDIAHLAGVLVHGLPAGGRS